MTFLPEDADLFHTREEAMLAAYRLANIYGNAYIEKVTVDGVADAYRVIDPRSVTVVAGKPVIPKTPTRASYVYDLEHVLDHKEEFVFAVGGELTRSAWDEIMAFITTVCTTKKCRPVIRCLESDWQTWQWATDEVDLPLPAYSVLRGVRIIRTTGSSLDPVPGEDVPEPQWVIVTDERHPFVVWGSLKGLSVSRVP